jgi:hypothetical protein
VLSADREALKRADARALKLGVPSMSLVRRVLYDVAHEIAGRCKDELERELDREGVDAFTDVVATLRAAIESDHTAEADHVGWLLVEERRSTHCLMSFRILNLTTTILLVIHPWRGRIPNHHQRTPSSTWSLRNRRSSRRRMRVRALNLATTALLHPWRVRISNHHQMNP